MALAAFRVLAQAPAGVASTGQDAAPARSPVRRWRRVGTADEVAHRATTMLPGAWLVFTDCMVARSRVWSAAVLVGVYRRTVRRTRPMNG